MRRGLVIAPAYRLRWGEQIQNAGFLLLHLTSNRWCNRCMNSLNMIARLPVSQMPHVVASVTCTFHSVNCNIAMRGSISAQDVARPWAIKLCPCCINNKNCELSSEHKDLLYAPWTY